MLEGNARPTIYIAGPMTGYDDFNFPAFDKVAKEWDERGYAVLNPASSFMRRQDLSYEQYMRSAVMLLIQASAIVLLPGWQKSNGACMEALMAARLGLFFYRADTGKGIETPEFGVSLTDGPKLPARLSGTHRAVLRAIRDKGLCTVVCNRCGMTCDDIERALDMTHSNVSARLWELHRLGYVVTTTYERKTRSGSLALPYILTEKGAVEV